MAGGGQFAVIQPVASSTRLDVARPAAANKGGDLLSAPRIPRGASAGR
jgi:hypothetical protein